MIEDVVNGESRSDTQQIKDDSHEDGDDARLSVCPSHFRFRS